jgi:hypothetical protein
LPSARFAAGVFALFSLAAGGFQLALAAGAPWGELAMGGAYPGVYPPAMRTAALVQIAIYLLLAAVVFARAGVALRGWRPASRWLIWLVVAIQAVAVVLNLITPSPLERLIWAPVAALLLASSLRVALSR